MATKSTLCTKFRLGRENLAIRAGRKEEGRHWLNRLDRAVKMPALRFNKTIRHHLRRHHERREYQSGEISRKFSISSTWIPIIPVFTAAIFRKIELYLPPFPPSPLPPIHQILHIFFPNQSKLSVRHYYYYYYNLTLVPPRFRIRKIRKIRKIHRCVFFFFSFSRAV